MPNLVLYVDEDILELKADLVRVSSLIRQLTDNLERIDAIYRHKFPNEIALLFDLENEINDLQRQVDATIGKQEEKEKPKSFQEKKDAKSRKKKIKNLYRRLCRLCHPDIVEHLGFDEESSLLLVNLFVAGKQAYKEKDYGAIRIVYEEVVYIHRKCISGGNEDAGEDPKVESIIKEEKTLKDLDDELKAELRVKLNLKLNDLRELESVPMYVVLAMDINNQKMEAQAVYKNIIGYRETVLRSKRSELQKILLEELSKFYGV